MKNSRPASLVLRVTVLVGLATTLSLVALGLFVQQSIALHFVEQEAEELQVIVDSVLTSLTLSENRDSATELARDLEGAVAGHHGVYFMVAGESGSPIFATPGPDLMKIARTVPSIATIESQSLYAWNESGSAYSGAVLNFAVTESNDLNSRSQDYKIVVAASMNEHFEFLSDFNRTLWSIIAGISLFAILAAWIAARQAHAPLHSLSTKIRNISSDQLDARLEESRVPVELEELVLSFNTMIVRMEDVFERLSNFSADIAHELRTPITNIITQTEVSLSKARGVEEYREILYSNLEEYEHLAKMIGDMLFLAQTDNGLIQPTFKHLKLADEIKELFDYYEAFAEERQVNLELYGECPEMFGDKDLLRRALSNLISNAIDHTSPNRSVVINLDSNEDSVKVAIENTGTGITPEQLPRIFDRFYQADPSRQREGAGLGLAIVNSIIKVHKGSIDATSANGVTCIVINLPLQEKST
ncbi:MAG: heavy metal sensor histidine kinase [Gammaproteobacteria bacterium]|nr:heavy metal sensor histidine kinase [Gammaproteobacteria bacterium]